MQIFYSNISDDKNFKLDESESRHLSRVLRLKAGDEAYVIDGSGTLFRCEVTRADPKSSVLAIISSQRDYNSRNYNLHIAIAPTKNLDRFEWFIEKTVEIGIDRITPIICSRSERRVLKTARSEKIIISAMKQSFKANKTVIDDPILLDTFLKSRSSYKKYIAHCCSEVNPVNLKEEYNKGEDALILIGPEGDFTGEEITNSKSKGFKEISLGPSRLRTETAGVAACSFVFFINHF